MKIFSILLAMIMLALPARAQSFGGIAGVASVTGSAMPFTVTLTNAVPDGSTLIVVAFVGSSTPNISFPAVSAGKFGFTNALQLTNSISTWNSYWLVSTNTSGLPSGYNVSVNFSGAGYNYFGAIVGYVTNGVAFAGGGTATGYGSTFSASLTAPATAVIVGAALNDAGAPASASLSVNSLGALANNFGAFFFSNAVPGGAVAASATWSGNVHADFSTLVLTNATLPESAFTNVFYVAQNATGDGSGSSPANCQSVAWLNARTASPGDRYILVGTITNALTPSGSGALTNPCMIQFSTNAILTAPTLTGGSGYWITLNNLSNWIVDGAPNGVMEATDTGTPITLGGIYDFTNGVGGIVLDDAQNITIRNLTFRNLYVHTSTNDCTLDTPNAIRGNNCPGPVTISNCQISNVCWAIVLTGGASAPAGTAGGNITIASNWFGNYDHGIASMMGYTNIFIYANQFGSTSNWDTSCNAWHHDGIHIFSAAYSGATVSGIYIYDNIFFGDWGINNTAHIFVQGENNTPYFTVTNIYIYNNVGFLGAHNLNNGFIAAAATNMIIANNTFVSGTGSAASYLTAINLPLFGGKFLNNNLVQPGVILALNASGWMTNYVSTIFFDHNLYSLNPAPNSPYAWTVDSAYGGYSTFSGWQNFIGSDANSIFVGANNPGVNADGTLQAGSLAAGAGTNLTALNLPGLNADFLGNPRPAVGAWDIGAFNAPTNLPPAPAPAPGGRVPRKLFFLR